MNAAVPRRPRVNDFVVKFQSPGFFPPIKKGGVGGSTLPLARVGAVAAFSAALQCVQTSVFLNS
jgi:hypothetical protein